MSATSICKTVLLLSAVLALGCGAEPTASASEPLAQAERDPGSPAPSLADWLPEGHTLGPAAAHGGGYDEHTELPPGHPPVGPAAHGAGGLPPGHPAVDGLPAADRGPAHDEPSAGATVSGTVRETMDAAGYTYMRVETETGMQWVAVSQRAIAIGEQVEATGSVMHGFRSNTLDRTFDRLVLAPSVRVGAPN